MRSINRLRQIAFAFVVTIALAAVGVRVAAAPPPIVILVSIDGFRWDYLERVVAPNLLALAARGVKSEGLIPPFPSKTFPSHYTLVTGLRPEHHGIVSNVDTAIGTLIDGIRAQNLQNSTTLVVVSDHGMSEVSDERVVYLDDYADFSGFDVVEWTPNLVVRPRSGSIDALEKALQGKHPALSVFKRAEMPASLFYWDSPRIAPSIGLAADGWTLTTQARFRPRPGLRGDHGYDPGYTSMHGLFIAAGPRVREGVTAPRFESINVYDVLCELLGLNPARNDGNASVTRAFLR